MYTVISDRRAKFRSGLHSLYLPYYDLLCLELKPHWQPYCGFRTFKEQDDLYAIGRTTPGKIITNARGGQSAHNYGCATDWCLWEDGKPVWNQKDPRWNEYEYLLAKFGLLWGGVFKLVDLPHNELAIKVRWTAVRNTFQKEGSDAGNKFIKENLIC